MGYLKKYFMNKSYSYEKQSKIWILLNLYYFYYILFWFETKKIYDPFFLQKAEKTNPLFNFFFFRKEIGHFHSSRIKNSNKRMGRSIAIAPWLYRRFGNYTRTADQRHNYR